MKFLLHYNMKIIIWWKGTNLWWRDKNLVRGVCWGGIFADGLGMTKLLAGGAESLHPPNPGHSCKLSMRKK